MYYKSNTNQSKTKECFPIWLYDFSRTPLSIVSQFGVSHSNFLGFLLKFLISLQGYDTTLWRDVSFSVPSV